LSRFPKWAATHKHPYEKNIPSQRSSELFASITEDAKDILKGKRRMYLHLYYNSERALEDEKSLNNLLCTLQAELERGKRNPEHEKQYAKYFDVKTTPSRGPKVTARQEAIVKQRRTMDTLCFSAMR